MPNTSTKHLCEIPGHDPMKDPVAKGRYQVYAEIDGKDIPTMTRAAWMCSECLKFATDCGMTPRAE